jgi:hypothetical protein
LSSAARRERLRFDLQQQEQEIMSEQIQTEQQKPETELYLLPLPAKLPENANPVATLCVFDDANTGEPYVSLHEVNAAAGSAEMWGDYLADIARVIARDWADHIGTQRPDDDVFKGICDGFLSNINKDQEGTTHV